MQEANSKSENSILDTVPGLRRFMKIYSIDPDSGDMSLTEHGFKYTESSSIKQPRKINLGKPFCANCGNPVTYGMFCSGKCEGEMYGVQI